MVTQKELKSNELKYLTKTELMEEAQKIKKEIHSELIDISSYILQDFVSDTEKLIDIFFHKTTYDKKVIDEITGKIEQIFAKYSITSNLNDLITALKLGYMHHVEHITTSKMCEELGITRQGLQRYLFDVADPESVKEARRKKHPMIPVRKYVSIVALAEKLDYEIFKNWYLGRKRAKQ